MPQLQVLQRMDDQSAQAIRSAGEQVNDSIQKKQQLEVMKQDLVIKGKMAQTDEEKMKLDRQRVFLDSMQKAMDQGVFKNERLAQGWMKMMGDNFGKEAFDFMASTGDALKGFQSPEADYKSAQAEDLRTQNDPAKQQALMDAKMGALKGFSGGGGFAPGSTLSQKMGDTTLNLQLNPNITGPEADTIASTQNMSTALPEINKAIDGGLFGKNSAERTVKQALVESDNAIMTSGDEKLGNFRSAYNVLRRASLFDEAGKALTGTEKTEQVRLLQLTGKTDAQIKHDLAILVEKNKNKRAAILGGTNAVTQPSNAAPTIVERRQTKDGRILAKYSDGHIAEVGNEQ